jgi:5-dehydro-2-deoxygluconokinase
LRGLYDAARRLNRELMIEIICGRHGDVGASTVARALRDLYALGIKPDWWKLEPQASSEAWDAIGETIERYDPFCRGVVLLGLEAPEADLAAGFSIASRLPAVRGFAVGRTIFAEAACGWFTGTIDDSAAVDDMAERFARLVEIWESERAA